MATLCHRGSNDQSLNLQTIYNRIQAHAIAAADMHINQHPPSMSEFKATNVKYLVQDTTTPTPSALRIKVLLTVGTA